MKKRGDNPLDDWDSGQEQHNPTSK
jgi:hypothetical protein